MTELLNTIARGGGGGSGGGGSGGGGSGGGGGGIFALWAYAIAHVCHLLMKLPKPVNYIACWLFAIIAAGISLKFPFGGGFAIAALVGGYLGVSGKLGAAYKYARNFKKVQKDLKQAATKDSEWDWAKLSTDITAIFMKFQEDWSQFNLVSIKTYTTPEYFERTSLLLTVLKSLGRQNRMSGVKIISMLPSSFTDQGDDKGDYVSVMIAAKANDVLWEGKERLYVDKSQFVEEWQLKRNDTDNGWLLYNIVQKGTQTPYLEIAKLLTFANSNKFIYSGDFGLLLMPKRGQLFSKANFKNSDINSHVVGVYRNIVVQFYSYIPSKNRSRTTGYVIAQAALPKSYGDIVVRHKSWWRFWTPHKLQRVVPEWGDFNKKYDVFASDIERVTSLELLNPAFMVNLEALPFKANIEVVDNNVYFYTSDQKADYRVLLELIGKAFNEMKL